MKLVGTDHFLKTVFFHYSPFSVHSSKILVSLSFFIVFFSSGSLEIYLGTKPAAPFLHLFWTQHLLTFSLQLVPQDLGCPGTCLSELGCTLFLRGGGLRFRLCVGMVVVWEGWLNKLEEKRVSLSVGGSQSRITGVRAEVDGNEGVGAGLPGGTLSVLGDGTWAGRVFVDGEGREEESVIGVGGGVLTEGMELCAEEETGLAFKKGTEVATGFFLGLMTIFSHSLGSSLLFVIFPLLLPFSFSLQLFWSIHAAETLSFPLPLWPVLLLPPWPLPPLSLLLYLLFCWVCSSLHSMWYRSSVAMVTRSSCCSRVSRVGRSLLREASVSALSLQLWPPTMIPGLSPNPKPRPMLMPGASVRLQGLDEAGCHEASEPASTLSGVGGESGPSSGGKHKDLQSLVEDERDGGSSIPSKRTLWRNWK